MLFQNIITQWRGGPNGPYALDYNVLYREFDDMGLKGDDREEWKAKFRVIESQALTEIHKPD